MLLVLWFRDDAAGLMADFKSGDIDRAVEDTDPIGTQEKKSRLVVKIPDPPNKQATVEAWLQSEYELSDNPEEPRIRRKRQYGITNWESKFTAEEIAVIKSNAGLPEGQFVQNGIVVGKFTGADVHPK